MKWLFVIALALTPLSASAQDISGSGRAMDGDSLDMAGVRRQNIWHNSRRKLAECGPRLGVDVRRRACGAASADVRWSVA